MKRKYLHIHLRTKQLLKKYPYSRGDLRRYMNETGWDRYIGSCEMRRGWRENAERIRRGEGGGGGGLPPPWFMKLVNNGIIPNLKCY